MSTEDSRSTQAAGQAATPGQALTGILFNRSWTIGRWETLAEGDRAEMESMAADFLAAIAAAAPAPAGEGVLLSALAGLWDAMYALASTLDTEADDNDGGLSDGLREGAQRIREELEHHRELPQAAPDLAARLAAVTALLDASHKRDWDSGLASEQARVAEERAGLGMGALL